MYDRGPHRRTYDLAFREHAGLVVRTRRPSYGALLLLEEAERVLGPGLAGTAVTGSARARALLPAVEAFAESLDGWTLLIDGVAVPPTLAGVKSLDYELVIDLVLTWYRRVALRPVSADAVPAVDPRTNEPPVTLEDDSDDLATELAALPVVTRPPDQIDSSSGEPATKSENDSPVGNEVSSGESNALPAES